MGVRRPRSVRFKPAQSGLRQQAEATLRYTAIERPPEPRHTT